MKYKFFLLSSLLVGAFFFKSCNSCSKSGRAQIIAMAKKEVSKKNTVPEPNTIIKDVEPEIVKIEDVVTLKGKKIINKDLIDSKIPPAEGNLIQTEGLVAKEVFELNVDLKLKDIRSKVEKIIAMQNHILKNWHYIFDPETGKDTWRSAEATLSLKYKGKYSGDCDDFAILMASIARQIGLESRMIGGFDGDSGHAFAEFLLTREYSLPNCDYRSDYSGKWISLDWFKGKEHNRFTHNIKVFENI